MSIQDKKEEAEAVLDSAEMILETYGGAGKRGRELETKIKELQQELQEPESESSLETLINDIRDLMENMKDQPDAMDDGMMGHEEAMGGPGGPDDSPPPI